MRVVKKSKIGQLSLADAKVDQVTQITRFLEENYRIAINRYDPSQMKVVSLKKRYVFPVTVDDIAIHMIQESVPHSRNVIKMILGSANQMKTYDPIREYFDSLKDSHPEESAIERLVSYLSIREFDDREEGYYTARAARLIRQWMVAAVACALDGVPNEAALMLVSETEGAGKTFLARFLCPDTLSDMYQKSAADGRSFHLDRALVSKFIVNYDEMVGLSPATAEEFKKGLSDDRIYVKMRGDIFPVVRQRIASIAGTTNNRTGARNGFLHPSMGTRRFMCIHIDEIDHDYSGEISVDDLWAEALHLYRTGFQYRLTREDYREFDEVNQRYMIETPASAILQFAYRVPRNEHDGEIEWMTATDVMNDLESRKLIPPDKVQQFTPQRVGEAMRSVGFVRKMHYNEGAPRYKYMVGMNRNTRPPEK